MSSDVHNGSGREERLQEVLVAYLEAVERGRAPEAQELLAQHPEFAAELTEFVANRAQLDGLAAPLRAVAEAAQAEADSRRTLVDGDRTTALVPGARLRYFGDYELLKEIAHGGMGVVFMARQVSLNRPVALKMILKGELASEADVRRFHDEAEAAAKLDHPNIVPIYEVGEHEGQHYFSMKLIEGPAIADFGLRIADWRTRQRWAAQLTATVARAVHHAHQRGILHRDLKPGNILLEAGESAIHNPQSAIPYVTDFGLAKPVEGERGQTQSGAIVGTPAYMPPEQARGEKQLTTAIDIYSLGAVLYELLTGRPPFRGATPLDTVMQVLDREPENPRSVNPAANRDLATICLKCLEKAPARRYESAAALADDLQRWLDGAPIEARPATAIERSWKWAKRRPAVAGLLAAVVVSLVLGTTVSTILAFDAAEQARQARDNAAQARHAAGVASARAKAEAKARGDADKARAAAELARSHEAKARATAEAAQKQEAAARKLADAAKAAKEREFVRADGLRLAAEADAARFRDPGLSLLLAAEGVKRAPNHLSFNTLYAALADCREEKTLFSNSSGSGREDGWYVFEGNATAARFAAPNRVLSAHGNSLRVWETDTGKVVSEWKGFNLPIGGIAVSPDGRRAAVISSGGFAPVRHANGTTYNYTDRLVFVIDLATGRELFRLRGATTANETVEFSADNSRLLAASWDGTARVWDANTGKLIRDINTGEMALLAARFTPDHKHVVTVTTNASKASYNYEESASFGNDKKIPTDPDFDPKAEPLGPTARSYAGLSGLGASNTVARIWDVDSGKEVASCYKLSPGWFDFSHIWYPQAADLSPDGKWIAVAFPGVVTVWETKTGKWAGDLKGHDGDIRALAFRPGGAQLASAGADGTIRLWDLAARREVLRLRSHTRPSPATPGAGLGVKAIAFSPSGKKLVSRGDDRVARVWNADTGAELAALRGHTDEIRDAAFHPDERRVVSAGDTSTRIWSLDSPPMPDLNLHGHTGKVTAIAYSPDGKSFLTASADQSARLWDTATGKLIREFGDGRPLGEVRSARFSPNGVRVVTASANRKAAAAGEVVRSAVIVWDVATGKEVLSLEELPTGATHAEFTPDGSRILTVGDGYLRVKISTAEEKKEQPKSVNIGGLSFAVTAGNSTAAGIQRLSGK